MKIAKRELRKTVNPSELPDTYFRKIFRQNKHFG